MKCRTGTCRNEATTFVQSHYKKKVIEYFFCREHWIKILNRGLKDND